MRIRKLAMWLAAGALLVAAVVYFAMPSSEDGIRVPLGVEQAAIVTYSGPLLVVAPYKWGVAVNVRIAQVTELPGRRVYDLRYIVNRAGAFDLRDYLAAADGGSLAGLPEFKFTGDPKLSKTLDTRIQETEEIRVDVGGHYYETIAGLGLLWAGWLLLLVYWKRPRPPAVPDPGPAAPTLAEMLRGCLNQIEAGTLDAAGKARLEMALLRCWRSESDLGNDPMITAMKLMHRNDRTLVSLRKLQHWLHHPESPVQAAEIAAVIKSCTAPAP